MKIFLELAAKTDKFRQGMQQGEKALEGFRQYAQKVGRTVQTLTQEIGFLGNAASALSSGMVLKKLFSVTDYMPVDDALLRMRVNFKNTAEEMNSFKNELTALAGETGEDQGRIFQMANNLSLSYKPGDIKEIITQADRISDATKAPLESSQEGLTQIMKLYKLSAAEAKGAADAIVASRVNLETLDVIMQRLAMRGGSKKDYIEALGMIRGLGKGGFDKPRLVAQLNEVMETIEDKAERLQNNGITVFSTDAEGNRVWRDKVEVLKDLETYVQKTGKTMSREQLSKGLDEVFGPKALTKLETLFAHIKDFEAGIQDMGNAAQIAADRAGAGAETWEKQINKIKAHLGGIKNDLSFIYDLAKKPVKFLAESPNLTKAAGYTAAGMSAVVLGALAVGNIKNLMAKLGKTAAGIAEGKAIEAATGVTPVFVVNAKDIGGGGGLEKAGVMAGIGAWLTKHVPWVAAGGLGLTATAVGAAALTTTTAGMATYDAYKGGTGDNWINDKFNETWKPLENPKDNLTDKLLNFFRSSATAGMAAGATSAAVLTTGSALNAGVDAARGGTGDNWIDDAFNRNIMAFDRDIIKPISALFDRSASQEVKNAINLTINIDKDGRVVADSGNQGAELMIELNRGTSFGVAAPAVPMGYK